MRSLVVACSLLDLMKAGSDRQILRPRVWWLLKVGGFEDRHAAMDRLPARPPGFSIKGPLKTILPFS